MDSTALPEIRTTYQMIAFAVYFGLSGLVGNISGGAIIGAFGYRTMYGVSILITISSSLFYFVHLKKVAAKGKISKEME